ncbi:aminotransferase class III-fold pyridoxal phosphate-dependent enzyme [Streptomyces deccanensis]|uniref:aminotransferase class III-fold pyridoxal phosphate-dependent enzyme n=1 Tax=Streptomyces deccanensis TaxID=424188 RepID=UPI001EFA5319|nr:aminotransferase class III-fold pyridoxal phosphate-dependent enzyme [Streptomyces deccanensis]ULR51526.1 aminotransferase class III-fold pyridoxal phosphate-dependent enzyme [Streptomyces deccanensis]
MEHTTESVFRPVTRRTLELMTEHNREQRCTFLMASNYVNSAAAGLGYLLDALVPAGSGGPRVSYLLSSGLEALSGAIKLARHSAVRAGRDAGGWVLLIDEYGRYQEFMDPLAVGTEEALIPHVVTVSSAEDARRRHPAVAWEAVVVVREDQTDLDDAALLDLTGRCRDRGGLVVLCATELDVSAPDLFANPVGADVVVFGENLSGRQVPFGVLTMSPAAHQVWHNRVDCFAHTSTYGGNTLCASLVRDALEQAGHVTEAHRQVLRAIHDDPRTTVEYWGRHINPDIAGMAQVFHLNIDAVRASGGRLTTRAGRDVIDCAGGFGSNLRGHNPPDLVPEVLDRHDPGHDYFADLERRLARLTGLPHAFPSVSGAVANHTAVTLAALAAPKRRTVVTFTGNYGGKTLFSLNLSKHGPQKTESDTDAFRPYYAHLAYIDPFAPDAVDRFRALLRTEDVALVWFELVQGAACRPLPADLVRAIDRHRDAHGYLVGVDEVLTGGWRTGEHYLAHTDVMRTADIVTLGKTLSDMTLPAAVVMVSDQVRSRAEETSPTHVARLRTEFRHNLGAHISAHALDAVDDPSQRAEQLAAYAELRAALDRLCRTSKVLGGVSGAHAHLKLTMGHRLLSFPHGSGPGTLLTMALSDLIHQRCGVYMPLLAIRHRVAADPEDLRELAARLEAGVCGITPLMIYRYAVGRLLHAKFPRLSRRLIGRAARPQVRATAPAVRPVPS